MKEIKNENIIKVEFYYVLKNPIKTTERKAHNLMLIKLELATKAFDLRFHKKWLACRTNHCIRPAKLPDSASSGRPETKELTEVDHR